MSWMKKVEKEIKKYWIREQKHHKQGEVAQCCLRNYNTRRIRPPALKETKLDFESHISLS